MKKIVSRIVKLIKTCKGESTYVKTIDMEIKNNSSFFRTHVVPLDEMDSGFTPLTKKEAIVVFNKNLPDDIDVTKHNVLLETIDTIDNTFSVIAFNVEGTNTLVIYTVSENNYYKTYLKLE